MKTIDKFETVKGSGKSLIELGINGTLYRAYMDSKKSENENIDFSDAIWDHDIEEIVKGLKENDIKKFTISSEFSNLLKTIERFTELGCTMEGLTKINAKYKNIFTEEQEIIPALMFSL